MTDTTTHLFAPIVNLDNDPQQNGDKPGIEKTTRICMCCVYEVPLYKAKWDRLSAGMRTRPLADNLNPYRELIPRNGLDAVMAEKERLIANFKPAVFYRVYPTDDAFRAAVMAVSKTENPWLVEQQQRQSDLEARGAERAAEALQKAAVQAIAKTESKRGPGRPRKNQEPATADA